MYGAAVYFWRDPVTDLYARWKQRGLSAELETLFAEHRAAVPAASAAAPADLPDAGVMRQTRLLATDFYDSLAAGQALGRLRIPRLGIDPVIVNGTRWGADLSRGPGRYLEGTIPGMGGVTAVAGHRTTFGAPFRHIDRLKRGDPIALELPYGTFTYVVIEHEIVDDDDWSILRPRGFETLVLSACHPLYSAAQRWIVYARLKSVELAGRQAYTVPLRETQPAAA